MLRDQFIFLRSLVLNIAKRPQTNKPLTIYDMKELYTTKEDMKNKDITDKPLRRIADAKEDNALCRECDNLYIYIYCDCKRYIIK